MWCSPSSKMMSWKSGCYICGDELPSKCKQRALNQVLRTETQTEKEKPEKERRQGRKPEVRRHQESFKGGRGYLCQMLLAKKLRETCLGSMSPCRCQ